MGNKRPTPKLLAKKLFAIRQHFELSQKRMAHLLDIEHYSRLSEFERGRRMPSWRVLLYYARLAGLPLEFIVDDDINLDYFKRNLAVVDQRRGELTDLIHECVVLFSPT